MVTDYVLNGIDIQTGDIICSIDGGGPHGKARLWKWIGRLIPGRVDHIAIYVGPNGRCVESGPNGVIAFEVTGNTWDAAMMHDTRGLIDTLHGIAYPLRGLSLDPVREEAIRQAVADYCLDAIGKPYNVLFANSQTDEAYYCSQLAYKAYIEHGIDLNTGQSVPDIPATETIIFPQEIWAGCEHVKT